LVPFFEPNKSKLIIILKIRCCNRFVTTIYYQRVLRILEFSRKMGYQRPTGSLAVSAVVECLLLQQFGNKKITM